MAIGPGTRFGHYDITSLLGEGGMGRVYRATDTQLGREVAIKVLPDAVAHDPERLLRFEREARTLASLTHPNIAIIHRLETAEGDAGLPARALVMELVEGLTLADRIAHGAMPVAEALPIARQIADALEAAHDHGIVHRDLKPANVKVREDGIVKVLDFGLAKALEPAAGASGASMMATITTPAMTQAGVILGTAAYMSPEQARGMPVDRRADIWAFGCVLFEMLAARRPFPEEDTVSDTLAGILKEEPAWDALPADTPPKLRALIERCLRKDVRRRLSHIAEARIEIEDAIREPASASPSVARSAHPGSRVWPVVAVVSLVTAAGLAARLLLAPAPPDPAVARFDIAPPPGAIEFGPLQRKIAVGDTISPDGRTVAFVAAVGGLPMIWLRALDSADVRPLARTENAGRPVWSPDSKSLAFAADGQIRTIPIAGGPPTVIAREAGRDLAWSPEGVILIGGQNKPLLRVSQDGGEATPATELGPNETTHDYPHVLPDGRHFIYVARRGQNPEDWDVYVGSLGSTERRLLRGLHAGVRYSRTGHLLFSRGTALMAQPFDVDRLELRGDAVQVGDGISSGVKPEFSISTDGSLAFLTIAPSQESQLAWFDRQGNQIEPVGPSGEFDRIRLSRDNRYVAFDRAIFGRSVDILLLDLERGRISPFVSSAAADFAPVWSPDGTRVAFSSSREPAGNAASTNTAVGNLYERPVGGVASETVVLKNDGGKTLTDWSRDGRHLAYFSGNGVWALPLPVSDATQPLRVTESGFAETGGRFSPDGQWIAYQSTESAVGQDVWVQSFPHRRARVQASVKGGSMPRWSRDGKELFYVAPDGMLMSVSVTRAGDELTLGTPQALFSSRALQGNREYEVADDGRFLLNVPVSNQTDPLVTVIVNWASRLK